MTKDWSTGEPLRVLPRHGKPTSHFEWLTQNGVKCLAFFPIYVIVISLLTFVTWSWIVPCVREHS